MLSLHFAAVVFALILHQPCLHHVSIKLCILAHPFWHILTIFIMHQSYLHHSSIKSCITFMHIASYLCSKILEFSHKCMLMLTSNVQYHSSYSTHASYSTQLHLK